MAETFTDVSWAPAITTAATALRKYILIHEADYDGVADWSEREMDAVRSLLRRVGYTDGSEPELEMFSATKGVPALLRVLALALEQNAVER